MKKLNCNLEVLENEGLQVKYSDLEIVNEYINAKIELTYDENSLKIYNEAGNYIADLEEV